MSNPAAKARELLKASRTQKHLTNIPSLNSNFNPGNSDNTIKIDKSEQEKQQEIDKLLNNIDSSTKTMDKKIEERVEKLDIKDVNINQSSQVMPENKSTGNNNINSHFNTGNTNSTKKNDLLKRMNKEKEPMKLTSLKKNDNAKPIRSNINSNITTIPEDPNKEGQTVTDEKTTKLMNRLATAKNMMKNKTEKTIMTKKQSEKIMMMVNVLERKKTNPEEDHEEEINKILEGGYGNGKHTVTKICKYDKNSNSKTTNNTTTTNKPQFLLDDDDVQHFDIDHIDNNENDDGK